MKSDAATPIDKLAHQLDVARSAGLSSQLAVLVLTTQHPGRLHALYRQASLRLLAAHRRVLDDPRSTRILDERLRSKVLLDFVRARIAALGCRRPGIDKIVALLDIPVSSRDVKVVHIRHAARAA